MRHQSSISSLSGQLSHKSGLADFKDWHRKSFGRHTPWGDQESKALVSAVEPALKRRLSEQVAVTPCRAASVKAEQLERGALHEELSKGHRREGKRPKKLVRD